MCDDWSSFTGSGSPLRPSREGRDETTFGLLFGLTAQAHELVRGGLPIMEPMTTAAHPVIRSVYELGVTAQWVYWVPGAELQVAKEAVRKRRNLINQMKKSTSTEFLQTAKRWEEEEESPDLSSVARMPSFEAVCGHFDTGDELYMHYRLMSGNTHAGAEAADRWLAIEEGRLVLRAHAREDPPAWMYFAVLGLMWASRALNDALKKSPRSNFLNRIAREAEISGQRLRPKERT